VIVADAIMAEMGELKSSHFCPIFAACFTELGLGLAVDKPEVNLLLEVS